ncbi:MAG: hypothetical protein E5W99_20220 [Mesorhizobium sp.]|nr:MAG: hypothetical protein E5W99_20220 [Mesorhizobium sp.]
MISYDDRETILSRPGDPKGFAPPVEIHSVRTSRRTGPDGQDLRQLIIEIVQQRRGFYDQNEQELQDKHGDNPSGADFVFRGGATLIFDLREGHLRYAVRKRISDDARLEQQRDFLAGYRFGSTAFGYGLQGGSTGTALDEPFALVHRGG